MSGIVARRRRRQPPFVSVEEATRRLELMLLRYVKAGDHADAGSVRVQLDVAGRPMITWTESDPDRFVFGAYKQWIGWDQLIAILTRATEED